MPTPDQAARGSKKFDLTALRFETICRHICHSDDCTIVSALAAEQFREDNWPLSFIPFEAPWHTCGISVRRVTTELPSESRCLAKIGAYIQEKPPKGVTPTFVA